MRSQPILFAGCLAGALALSFGIANAADCPVDHAKLAQALRASVKASGGPSNGGFDNHEWASIVPRDDARPFVVIKAAVGGASARFDARPQGLRELGVIHRAVRRIRNPERKRQRPCQATGEQDRLRSHDVSLQAWNQRSTNVLTSGWFRENAECWDESRRGFALC